MKKLLAIIISVMLLTSVVACNKDDSDDKSVSTASNSVASSKTSVDDAGSSVVPQPTPVSAKFFSQGIRKTVVQGEKVVYTGIAARVLYSDNKEYVFGPEYLNIDNGGFDSNVPGSYHHTVTFPGLSERHEFDIEVIKKPAEASGIVNISVDCNYSGTKGAEDSKGYACYKTLNDALLVLQYGGYSDTSFKNVYISIGKYNEKLMIPSAVKNVRFIGMNEDASKTVISYGDCSDTGGGTDGSSTVTVKGSGFMAKNITFENSYDYINGTHSNKQAVAFLNESDGSVLYNCVFLGYQDTLQAKNNRQYYKDCTIKGTTDFIFGKAAVALFENCDIVTRFTKERATNNGYVTAHSGYLATPSVDGTKGMEFGYIFSGCRLTAETGVLPGTVSLGRPWRCDATVAYINCEMGEHISTVAFGTENANKTRYTSMSGGNRTNVPSEANFVEFGNTGAGATNVDTEDFTLLTNADNYTIANIFTKTNGKVSFATDWDAQASLTALKAIA